MVSNQVAAGALALMCIAAAGAGGYLATRHNVTSVATPAAASIAAPAAQPAEPSRGQAGTTADAAAATSPAVTPPPAATRDKQPVRDAAVKPGREPNRSAIPASARSSDRSPAGTTPPLHAPRDTEPVPAIDRPGSGTAAPAPATGAPAPTADTPPLTARVEDLRAETPREPDTKHAVRVEELVVAADSVIGVRTESPVSSERSRIEDRIEARVVRDVRVGSTVAIAAGTRALGTVVLAERGGRFRERARLGIRFHTLLLADGTSLPINTDTIYRLGEEPGNASAARIGGGAVVGAIIGGIVGGGKGAAIGATTGAGAGTASVMSSERSAVTLPAGTEMTARILSPITVTVERE